ncbi:MAG: magnesium/cobalt transporter CorA [Ekhidna sp.]|nr:magnesium/cobalt transporter CorA [Ekhidna sp.]
MIHLIQYDANSFWEKHDINPSEAAELIDAKKINWIDVDHAEKLLVEDTSSFFNVHPLITEDILNTDHLPKFEAFEDHIFLSLKMLRYDSESNQITQEHLNIVLFEHLLITFQEGLPGDVFDDLRKRLSMGKGIIRKNTIEYLLYHCLDAVVDNYMDISEQLRKQMENIEAALITDTQFDAPEEVILLKKKVNTLRMYTLPLWDAFKQMQAEGSKFFHPESKVYFEDISDHIKFLLSFFDTAREMLRDIMDLYQTNINNEMNKVMKTLTVVSAIFIPLTFIAGVYGMNFDFMPELHYDWGYAYVWGMMVFTTIAMVFYMKKKKWL